MNDLISRSALYDEIRKLPLLSEYGRVAWEYSLAIEHLLKIVESQPSVDAVAIRCKDCKYHSVKYSDYCWFHDDNKSDDDFCSDWEKKDEK